jgi:uncharacterized protein (DUF486 family)
MKLSFTIILLFLSNAFMTAAWYGHLKFPKLTWWHAIAISWGLAFFEYCLQVPANRLSYGVLTAYQLKILQEAITLAVFVGFAWLFLGETLRPKYLVSFALMLAAVWVAFREG